MDREDVAHRLAQIVIDATAEPNGPDNRAEVVVQEDDGGSLAGDIGAAAAHGDPDVSGLERGRIIHTIARHADDVAICLERVDDTQLLRRHDAGKHRRRPDAHCEFGGAERLHLLACRDIDDIETRLRGNRARRRGIIAGDHHHANTGRAAFLDGRRDRRSQRVGKPNEAEVFKFEVVRRGGPFATGKGCTRNAQDAHAAVGHLIRRAP